MNPEIETPKEIAAPAPLNIQEIREKLSRLEGKKYWKSLEQAADSPEFQQFVEKEFPGGIDFLNNPVTRRQMLKYMGASLALAGLAACTRQPTEKILPYVKMPEYVVPGKPLYYATSVTRQGAARGVLVESHMGHPTKVDGNPEHPDGLGSSDIFMQAAVLDLYDPDRSKAILKQDEISGWGQFVSALQSQRDAAGANRGRGFHILTETIASPSLGAALMAFLAKYPEAQWHQYEAVNRDNSHAGAKMAFGRVVEPIYKFDQADVIVALDSDFLNDPRGGLRYTRDYTARRQVNDLERGRNRLYVVEPTVSVTGTMADHRFPVRASDIPAVAAALAAELGVGPGASSPFPWISIVAKDLKSRRANALVLAGEGQPAEVHALAHAMNAALGSAGRTVQYIDSIETNPVDQNASLKSLAEAMDKGEVDTLLMIGVNPVYSAPADLQFAERLEKVPFRAHAGLYQDETARLCHWHVPLAHEFESWGDGRAFDGTVTFQQPLIEPLYGGHAPIEIVSGLLESPARADYDLLRDHWQKQAHGDFEAFWRRSVHDGFVKDSAFTARVYPAKAPAKLPPAAQGVEVVIRPDATIWDGRYANNGWLQELSKPITKLTWDNAAMVAPALAERLNLKMQDVIEIDSPTGGVRLPVWILPGQADNSITISLGFGRVRSGRVGNKTGTDIRTVRSSETPVLFTASSVKRIRGHRKLASTQNHQSMEGRELVRVGTVDEYKKDPTFAAEREPDPAPQTTLYGPMKQSDLYAWGMAIDLNACIGCGACTISCQAENNIPIVGKENVENAREMQWIRVDRYFEGNLDKPEVVHQPVPCMHCENAPCEVVCPVGATTHSEEGLNEMTYNRCIGTRYCSNNCPYKVRRFNFFRYTEKWESLKFQRNPDVTVRSRGVMEKCTYCVQRISHARIDAEKENRTIRDGDIVTACQQACPARAIVFGNIKDKDSAISKQKADPRNYGILTDLNTRPRTTYLARINNPNPELEHV